MKCSNLVPHSASILVALTGQLEADLLSAIATRCRRVKGSAQRLRRCNQVWAQQAAAPDPHSNPPQTEHTHTRGPAYTSTVNCNWVQCLRFHTQTKSHPATTATELGKPEGRTPNNSKTTGCFVPTVIFNSYHMPVRFPEKEGCCGVLASKST